MDIHIPLGFGYWTIPAALTIAICFVYKRMIPRPEREVKSLDDLASIVFDGFTELVALAVAIIVTLAIWLIFFIIIAAHV